MRTSKLIITAAFTSLSVLAMAALHQQQLTLLKM